MPTPTPAVFRSGPMDGQEMPDPRKPWIEVVFPNVIRSVEHVHPTLSSPGRVLFYRRVPDRIDGGRSIFALAGDEGRALTIADTGYPMKPGGAVTLPALRVLRDGAPEPHYRAAHEREVNLPSCNAVQRWQRKEVRHGT